MLCRCCLSSVTASPGTGSSPGASSSSRGASCLVMLVGWGRGRDRRSSRIWSLWGNSQRGPENPLGELPFHLVVHHSSCSSRTLLHRSPWRSCSESSGGASPAMSSAQPSIPPGFSAGAGASAGGAGEGAGAPPSRPGAGGCLKRGILSGNWRGHGGDALTGTARSSLNTCIGIGGDGG